MENITTEDLVDSPRKIALTSLALLAGLAIGEAFNRGTGNNIAWRACSDLVFMRATIGLVPLADRLLEGVDPQIQNS